MEPSAAPSIRSDRRFALFNAAVSIAGLSFIAFILLRSNAGRQFDPEIVPILVGLDRSILDRPPERPDDLPTMLRQDDLVRAALGNGGNPTPAKSPAAATDEGSLTSRPALASDDAP